MSSIQFRQLRRTTTFKLTVLYGLLFAVGSLALLGMVYLRSSVYLSLRVDRILLTEAQALMSSPRPGLRQRIGEDLALNGERNNLFALFATDGTLLAGNVAHLPSRLKIDSDPVELSVRDGLPYNARVLARRLPQGEILLVGRDAEQLAEIRSIITSALIWSGLFITVVGLGCAFALSVRPLRRLRQLQVAAQAIASGDLKMRMPHSGCFDELDMFATTVNAMIQQIERLMSEVKGATETIAHDLLSPLARSVMRLRDLQRDAPAVADSIDSVAGDIEKVLDRFRAILRIAELDARQRRAGFTRTDLGEIVRSAEELYEPLAEAAGVRLLALPERDILVTADPQLIFEAVCNLVDNAIKFAGRGSTVQIRTSHAGEAPQLIVQDDGPGLPDEEREAVLQRFYRAERGRSVSGSGVGLNVVAALVRLHDAELVLEDAAPGLRVIIRFKPLGSPPASVSPA